MTAGFTHELARPGPAWFFVLLALALGAFAAAAGAALVVERSRRSPDPSWAGAATLVVLLAFASAALYPIAAAARASVVAAAACDPRRPWILYADEPEAQCAVGLAVSVREARIATVAAITPLALVVAAAARARRTGTRARVASFAFAFASLAVLAPAAWLARPVDARTRFAEGLLASARAGPRRTHVGGRAIGCVHLDAARRLVGDAELSALASDLDALEASCGDRPRPSSGHGP